VAELAEARGVGDQVDFDDLPILRRLVSHVPQPRQPLPERRKPHVAALLEHDAHGETDDGIIGRAIDDVGGQPHRGVLGQRDDPGGTRADTFDRSRAAVYFLDVYPWR